MTRNGDREKVSLSGSNWLGIIATVAIALTGQWFLLGGRVATLEAHRANDVHRLDSLEQRQDAMRAEVLNELRLLRREIAR